MKGKRQLVSNASNLAVLTLSNYLLGLLIFPYLSRVLDVEGFGLLGFSMSFVVVFQVVVEYGFMISATAEIARHRDDPESVGEVISTTMLAKCVLVVVAVAGLLVASLFLPMVRENLPVVGLFLLSAVLAALLPDFYFRGVERMGSIAFRAFASKLSALVLIVCFVRGEEQLLLIPIALAFGNGLAVGLGLLSIRRDGVVLSVPSLNSVLSSLRQGAGFFASRVAASVNQSAGAFALGLQVAPASVVMGQFAGASRIASAGELAVIPISDAIYPRMVRDRDYRLFRKVYFAGLIFWFLGCLLAFVFSREICVFLLGLPYAESGDLLRILLFGTFMAYSSNLFGYPALSPLGLARHANWALVISAGLNVTAYALLWSMDSVTAVSVCTVMAATNAVVFLYRVGVFIAYRRRTAS